MTKHYAPVDAVGGMPISANYAAELAAVNHQITPNDAKDMIAAFGANDGEAFNDLPLCETFNAAAIQQLLSAPGTIGLRIYNGTDAGGNGCFVLASVNADGRDMTMDGVNTGIVAEDGQRYPTKKKPVPKKPKAGEDSDDN